MKPKKPAPSIEDIAMLPDAWERTARAIKAAARAVPIHQSKPKARAAKRRKSIVRKERQL